VDEHGLVSFLRRTVSPGKQKKLSQYRDVLLVQGEEKKAARRGSHNQLGPFAAKGLNSWRKLSGRCWLRSEVKKNGRKDKHLLRSVKLAALIVRAGGLTPSSGRPFICKEYDHSVSDSCMRANIFSRR